MLATTREAAGELVAQFRGRGVHKYYVALSERKPAKKMGSVSGDMQARAAGFRMCGRLLPRTTNRSLLPLMLPSPLAACAHAPTPPLLPCSAARPPRQLDAEPQHPEPSGHSLHQRSGGGLRQPAAAGVPAQASHRADAPAAGGPEEPGGACAGRRGASGAWSFGAAWNCGAAVDRLLVRRDWRPQQALQAQASCPSTLLHLCAVVLTTAAHPASQRYAAAAAAAQEDRGYLHCAAMRFNLGGRPVQVVCPPSHGREFEAEAFQQQFAAWLPPSLEEDLGPWFPDNKLLRSELDI